MRWGGDGEDEKTKHVADMNGVHCGNCIKTTLNDVIWSLSIRVFPDVILFMLKLCCHKTIKSEGKTVTTFCYFEALKDSAASLSNPLNTGIFFKKNEWIKETEKISIIWQIKNVSWNQNATINQNWHAHQQKAIKNTNKTLLACIGERQRRFQGESKLQSWKMEAEQLNNGISDLVWLWLNQ